MENKSMQVLHHRGNKIGHDGAPAIAEGIKADPSLTTLVDVKSNHLAVLGSDSSSSNKSNKDNDDILAPLQTLPSVSQSREKADMQGQGQDQDQDTDPDHTHLVVDKKGHRRASAMHSYGFDSNDKDSIDTIGSYLSGDCRKFGTQEGGCNLAQFESENKWEGDCIKTDTNYKRYTLRSFVLSKLILPEADETQSSQTATVNNLMNSPLDHTDIKLHAIPEERKQLSITESSEELFFSQADQETTDSSNDSQGNLNESIQTSQVHPIFRMEYFEGNTTKGVFYLDVQSRIILLPPKMIQESKSFGKFTASADFKDGIYFGFCYTIEENRERSRTRIRVMVAKHASAFQRLLLQFETSAPSILEYLPRRFLLEDLMLLYNDSQESILEYPGKVTLSVNNTVTGEETSSSQAKEGLFVLDPSIGSLTFWCKSSTKSSNNTWMLSPSIPFIPLTSRSQLALPTEKSKIGGIIEIQTPSVQDVKTMIECNLLLEEEGKEVKGGVDTYKIATEWFKQLQQMLLEFCITHRPLKRMSTFLPHLDDYLQDWKEIYLFLPEKVDTKEDEKVKAMARKGIVAEIKRTKYEGQDALLWRHKVYRTRKIYQHQMELCKKGYFGQKDSDSGTFHITYLTSEAGSPDLARYYMDFKANNHFDNYFNSIRRFSSNERIPSSPFIEKSTKILKKVSEHKASENDLEQFEFLFEKIRRLEQEGALSVQRSLRDIKERENHKKLQGLLPCLVDAFVNMKQSPYTEKIVKESLRTLIGAFASEQHLLEDILRDHLFYPGRLEEDQEKGERILEMMKMMLISAPAVHSYLKKHVQSLLQDEKKSEQSSNQNSIFYQLHNLWPCHALQEPLFSVLNLLMNYSFHPEVLKHRLDEVPAPQALNIPESSKIRDNYASQARNVKIDYQFNNKLRKLFPGNGAVGGTRESDYYHDLEKILEAVDQQRSDIKLPLSHGPHICDGTHRCWLHPCASVNHDQCALSTLTVRNKLRVAKDVCEDLIRLHEQGINHCDVKAGNILLLADPPDQTSAEKTRLAYLILHPNTCSTSSLSKSWAIKGHVLPRARQSLYNHKDPSEAYRWFPPNLFDHFGFALSPDKWMYGMLLAELLTNRKPYSHWPRRRDVVSSIRSMNPRTMMPISKSLALEISRPNAQRPTPGIHSRLYEPSCALVKLWLETIQRCMNTQQPNSMDEISQDITMMISSLPEETRSG